MLLDRYWELALQGPSKGSPLIEAIPKGDVEQNQCYFLFHQVSTEVGNDHAKDSKIQEDASDSTHSVELNSPSAHFILESLKLTLEALSNTVYNMLLHCLNIKILHQLLCINIGFDVLHEIVNFWHAIVDEETCNTPDKVDKV